MHFADGKLKSHLEWPKYHTGFQYPMADWCLSRQLSGGYPIPSKSLYDDTIWVTAPWHQSSRCMNHAEKLYQRVDKGRWRFYFERRHCTLCGRGTFGWPLTYAAFGLYPTGTIAKKVGGSLRQTANHKVEFPANFSAIWCKCTHYLKHHKRSYWSGSRMTTQESR